MAEKVIIDIELKGFKDAEKNLKKLTEAQIAETDAIKLTNQQIKFYEKTLAELQSAKLKNGKLTESQTLKEAKYEEKLMSAKTSLTSQKDELQKTNAERRNAVKELSTLTTANQAQLGSNERMKAQLKLLTAQYNGLSASERENSNVGKKMGADILALTEKLKANEKAVGDNRRNVGNYSGALTRLGGTLRNVAGAFGVFFGAAAIGKIIKDSTKIITSFETSLVNLSNVLGVSRNEMSLLKDQAVELGATTAFSATEVLKLQEAYARLGFSQQQIIDLTPGTINGALALRASADETAELVGAVVNSFDDLASIDSVKIIDQLTASTQNSALNFQKLNSALPKVAGAANAAGVPFDKLLALLGKLSDAGVDASKSGTALKNIFIAAAKDGKDYSEILEEIASSSDTLTAAVDKTGKISAVSGTILANTLKETEQLNKDILDSVGTSAKVAEESLDTTEGKIKLLGSAWEGFVLSIDEGDGVISSMIKGVLDFLTGGLTILTENTRGIKNALILLTGAIALYNAKLILSTALTVKNAIATKLKAASDFLLTTAMGAASLATAAYTTIVGVLTGSISLATAASIAFKATLDVLSGGLTLVITAIAAAVGAMLIMINRTKELSATQQGLLDVQKEANKSYVKEKIEVDKLVGTLENEHTTREDKLSAIKELNKIMPKGIEKITEEDIATGALTLKINALNEAKVKQYKVAALANKQVETAEKLLDAEASSIQDNTKWYDYLTLTSLPGVIAAMLGYNVVTENAIIRRDETIKGLKDEAEAYAEEESAIIAELDALMGLNKEKETEVELTQTQIDTKKRASEAAASAKEKADEDEKERIESLKELLRTEKENLEFEKDKLLEELKLSEEGKELTQREADAKKVIIDQYNKDVAKLEQDATKESQELALKAIEDRIKNEEDAAALLTLQNEKKYLEDLNAAKGNEEEQKRLTKERNLARLEEAKTLAQQLEQILLQNTSDLEASADGGIADALLSEEDLADLRKRLLEAGVEVEKINALINDSGEDEQGNTLGSKLGLDEEQTKILIASYEAVVGGISDILNVASQNLKTNTDERIAAIDKQVQGGALSEEEAEKKREQVRKDAFQKQKKLDLGRANLSYFTGLIQAIASAMGLPPPANFIAGAISTASLTAAYAANVKQIKAQKFAEGGVIQGNSHAQGGVPFTVAGRGGFEAEGGEFIHKTKAVEHYGLPFMNALNNLQLPKMFAEGGYVAPVTASSISQQVSDGVSELVSVNENRGVQVINVEQDFSNLQNKVNNVESARTY